MAFQGHPLLWGVVPRLSPGTRHTPFYTHNLLLSDIRPAICDVDLCKQEHKQERYGILVEGSYEVFGHMCSWILNCRLLLVCFKGILTEFLSFCMRIM